MGTYRTEIETNTYSDVIEYAKNPTPSKESIRRGLNESITNGESFTGTKDMKEAITLAENGWDAGIDQMDVTDGIDVGGGIEFTPNVHGSVVNIGNYLNGLPDTMYELTEKREFNLEELTIYARLNYHGGINTKEALKYAISVLKIVNLYQSKYNVRIVGRTHSDFYDHKVKYVSETVIKDFDERFVLNNLAFAFHPSFFRRMIFAQYEKHEFNQYGYSRPISSSEYITQIQKENEEALYSKKKYIITPSLGTDTDGSFTEENIKKYNF